MPLPLGHQHRQRPRKRGRKAPRELAHHIRQELVRAAHDETVLQHAVQSRPPRLFRRQGLVVGVAVPHRRVAEEGRAPGSGHGRGEEVFAGVARHAGPVEVEARPGG